MSTWSFYNLETGLFHSGTFTTGARAPARAMRDVNANTPEGFAAIEGRYDRLTQRVDVDTGQVIAYERPPSEIADEQQTADEQRARRGIEALEVAQLRPLRELAIDPDNATAKQRLVDIDAEIVALRPPLAP